MGGVITVHLLETISPRSFSQPGSRFLQPLFTKGGVASKQTTPW